MLTNIDCGGGGAMPPEREGEEGHLLVAIRMETYMQYGIQRDQSPGEP